MLSGASRGIGKAIAIQLHSEGYKLSLGLRNPASSPLPAGDNVFICPFDALDNPSHRNWVEASAKQFGKIDGLINCAGILKMVNFASCDEQEEDLDQLFAVNVKSPWRLICHTLPYLKQSKSAKVINISSLSGKRVTGKSVGYAMSKFAVMALTHTLRFAEWDNKIRATAICPSFVNTDMVQSVKGLDTIAVDEMTQPEEIAKAVSFLLALPPNASVSELTINCRPDPHY